MVIRSRHETDNPPESWRCRKPASLLGLAWWGERGSNPHGLSAGRF
jgi:hypothetical protein